MDVDDPMTRAEYTDRMLSLGVEVVDAALHEDPSVARSAFLYVAATYCVTAGVPDEAALEAFRKALAQARAGGH